MNHQKNDIVDIYDLDHFKNGLIRCFEENYNQLDCIYRYSIAKAIVELELIKKNKIKGGIRNG